MRPVKILWDDDDNPDGNVEHIAEHGLTKDDVEHVLENCEDSTVSKSTGRPVVFGHTPDGEYIIVVYDEPDATTIYPITAYPVPEPRRKKR